MTRSTSPPTPPIPAPHGRVLLALLAIGVLAGLLRFPGLDYLLPLTVEPDAHIVVQVQTIETGIPLASESDDWAKYPLVTAYLAALTANPAPLPPKNATLDVHLKAAAAPVLRVRKTVAWLSLLVVPAGWLLARRFMSDRWALLAALLAGTSLLAIHFGTQARPHGAAVAWPGLTVVACMRLARSPTIKNYLLVTLVGGLAIGTLQSGVGLGFPVLLAHVLKNRGWRRHLRLLIPLAGLTLAFLFCYPFLFEGVNLTKTADTLELGGHEMFLSQFKGGGLPIILRTLIGWEPALTIGVLLALLVTLRNRMSQGLAAGTRIERRITLAYVLPYLLVIALNPRTGERFMLPLIPFLAAWTAWGLSRLNTQGARRLALTLAALLALFPTLVGIKLCVLRQRPSTLDHAAQWLATHVADKDDPIYVFRPNVLPLFKTDESTAADEADHPLAHRRQLNWSSYQRDQLQGRPQEQAWNLRFSPIEKERLKTMKDDPARYLEDLTGGRLFILEVYEDHRVLHAFNNLTEAVRSLYPKLTEFKPGPPHEVPLAYQDLTRPAPPAFALRVLRAERFGPPLEVFALNAMRQ